MFILMVEYINEAMNCWKDLFFKKIISLRERWREIFYQLVYSQMSTRWGLSQANAKR